MTHEPLAAVLTASEVARRDPDPLNPTDVDNAYEQGWADGHVSWKAIEAARARRRDHIGAIVVLAAAVALLVIGYLVGVVTTHAAPRSGPEQPASTGRASAQGQIGAPPRDGMPVEAAAEASRAATALDVEVGGAPTSPGIELGTAIESGILAFADPSLGDRYLAIPSGPGHRVQICVDRRCVDRVSTDAGPALFRQREGRIADVSFADFTKLCACNPRIRGLIVGTIEYLDGPGATPPPTDLEP